jgi:mono/diheme cytochrome c family protein
MKSTLSFIIRPALNWKLGTRDSKPSPVKLGLVITSVALFAAACGAREDAGAPRADPRAALFQKHCAVCHGPRGEGKQVGTLKVPSLREGSALEASDERVFRQISDGGNGMPPFKYTLDDEQIQDLVRFVRGDLRAASPVK